MLAARFIAGAGAGSHFSVTSRDSPDLGNVSTLKAYGAMASVAKDRGRAIAMVTSGIALGGTFGPGN